MKRTTFSRISMAIMGAAAVTGCAGDNEVQDAPGFSSGFVFATTVQDGDKTPGVLLASENIDGGSVSPKGNGLVNDGATEWVFWGDSYLYALTYNQGNAGTTRSYVMESDGSFRARSAEYKVSRFTSFGKYDRYIIAASTGDGLPENADANGNLPKTILLTCLDVDGEVAVSSDSHNPNYLSENFFGNGEYATLSGFEESRGKLYSAAIGMGLSAYGSAIDNGRYILPGNEDLVKQESGGSGGGSYTKGELPGTQYPDECYVAIFDNEKLEGRRVIRTEKISYACGRYRSQYYQTIWAADNGDIYVFSPSFAKTLTDTRQQTRLPAGVVRIKAGATDFDPDYYYNLEAVSGGKSFLRCWPAGGNYFLLRMYDRPFSQRGYVATELAIFNGDNGELTFVTGLPDAASISDFGKTPYVSGGYVYMPVMTSDDGYPAVYRIDPVTAQAAKGVVLEVNTVAAVGRLSSH